MRGGFRGQREGKAVEEKGTQKLRPRLTWILEADVQQQAWLHGRGTRGSHRKRSNFMSVAQCVAATSGHRAASVVDIQMPNALYYELSAIIRESAAVSAAIKRCILRSSRFGEHLSPHEVMWVLLEIFHIKMFFFEIVRNGSM